MGALGQAISSCVRRASDRGELSTACLGRRSSKRRSSERANRSPEKPPRAVQRTTASMATKKAVQKERRDQQDRRQAAIRNATAAVHSTTESRSTIEDRESVRSTADRQNEIERAASRQREDRAAQCDANHSRKRPATDAREAAFSVATVWRRRSRGENLAVLRRVTIEDAFTSHARKELRSQAAPLCFGGALRPARETEAVALSDGRASRE